MVESMQRLTQQGYGAAPVVDIPVFQSRDQVADFGQWVNPMGDVIFKSKMLASMGSDAQEATGAWFKFETEKEKTRQGKLMGMVDTLNDIDENIEEAAEEEASAQNDLNTLDATIVRLETSADLLEETRADIEQMRCNGAISDNQVMALYHDPAELTRLYAMGADRWLLEWDDSTSRWMMEQEQARREGLGDQ